MFLLTPEQERLFLYGDDTTVYQGLLPTAERKPLPPSTITRQRRRAAARAEAKGRSA